MICRANPQTSSMRRRKFTATRAIRKPGTKGAAIGYCREKTDRWMEELPRCDCGRKPTDVFNLDGRVRIELYGYNSIHVGAEEGGGNGWELGRKVEWGRWRVARCGGRVAVRGRRRSRDGEDGRDEREKINQGLSSNAGKGTTGQWDEETGGRVVQLGWEKGRVQNKSGTM